jgi:hypothetical protein
MLRATLLKYRKSALCKYFITVLISHIVNVWFVFVHFFAENIVVFIEFLMTCFLIRRNSYKANKAVQVYRILSQYLHYFAPNNVITYLMTNAFLRFLITAWCSSSMLLATILHLQHLCFYYSFKAHYRLLKFIEVFIFLKVLYNSTLPNFLICCSSSKCTDFF